MNSKRALYALIGLSALAACAQYVIQGTLATGGTPASFGALFLLADSALWGCRALIEAAVIVYLFMTVPKTRAQSFILGAFEFALIAMITLTIGPSLRAMGLGLALKDTMPGELFVLWNFGLAGYTSLMMGAAGYAYRVQAGAVENADVELEAKAQALVEAQNEIERLRKQLEQAPQPALLRGRGASKYPLFVEAQRGRDGQGTMTGAEIVRTFGVDLSTAGRWLKKYAEEGV